MTVAIEIARGRDKGFLTCQNRSFWVSYPIPDRQFSSGLLVETTTNIGLHPVAADMFHLVSTSVVPAAPFVLGSSLASYSISGSIGPAVLITVLKKYCPPGSCVLLWFLVGSKHALVIGSNDVSRHAYRHEYVPFASRYQVSPPTATTSIFISTISIVTVSIVIVMLEIV